MIARTEIPIITNNYNYNNHNNTNIYPNNTNRNNTYADNTYHGNIFPNHNTNNSFRGNSYRGNLTVLFELSSHLWDLIKLSLRKRCCLNTSTRSKWRSGYGVEPQLWIFWSGASWTECPWSFSGTIGSGFKLRERSLGGSSGDCEIELSLPLHDISGAVTYHGKLLLNVSFIVADNELEYEAALWLVISGDRLSLLVG